MMRLEYSGLGARAGRTFAWLVPVALTLVVTTNCSTSRPPDVTAQGDEPLATGRSTSDTTNGVQPGDAVLVRNYRDRATGEGEQSTPGDTIWVDEDGRATFPLLGTREVAGLSTDSLRRSLRAAYSEYLRDPPMDIRVLRRIAVLGAVRQPGLYAVDPTIGLTEVLARAGGTTDAADHDDVQIVREGRVVTRTTLEESLRITELPVRSGDRIWVGERSFFARNWQWIAGTALSTSFVLFLR